MTGEVTGDTMGDWKPQAGQSQAGQSNYPRGHQMRHSRPLSPFYNMGKKTLDSRKGQRTNQKHRNVLEFRAEKPVHKNLTVLLLKCFLSKN